MFAKIFGSNFHPSLKINLQLQVVLSAVELATLRSEIADLEEREAHLKAQ